MNESVSNITSYTQQKGHSLVMVNVLLSSSKDTSTSNISKDTPFHYRRSPIIAPDPYNRDGVVIGRDT